MSERKIVDYLVVHEKTITIIEIKVKENIKDGYHPIGGISFCKANQDNYPYLFLQAMVKYED